MVRAYIDGFNLYYGGKGLAADAQEGSDAAPSWKWLDIRALAQTIAELRWWGRSPVVVTSPTAPPGSSGIGPQSRARPPTCAALERSRCVDLIEYGLFKETYRRYPRATRDAKGRPILVGGGVPQMVGVSHREEKGSDVNLASRLLIDALTGRMEAAIVVSNDSDLSLPLREARRLMPVGTVSPHPGPVHGSLRPKPRRGSGHWYHSLTIDELAAAQLPDPCEDIRRPTSW